MYAKATQVTEPHRVSHARITICLDTNIHTEREKAMVKTKTISNVDCYVRDRADCLICSTARLSAFSS